MVTVDAWCSKSAREGEMSQDRCWELTIERMLEHLLPEVFINPLLAVEPIPRRLKNKVC